MRGTVVGVEFRNGNPAEGGVTLGGGRGKTPNSRANLDAGRAKGVAARVARKEAGMKAAREWARQHLALAATGHMPFAGHRTQAEVRECEELPRAATDAEIARLRESGVL